MKTAKQIVAEYRGIEEHQIAGRNQMLVDAIKEHAKQKVTEKTDSIKNQFCLGYHPEPYDEYEWDEEAIEKIDNAPEPEFD